MLCRSGFHLSGSVTHDACQDLSASGQQLPNAAATHLMGDDVRLWIDVLAKTTVN